MWKCSQSDNHKLLTIAHRWSLNEKIDNREKKNFFAHDVFSLSSCCVSYGSSLFLSVFFALVIGFCYFQTGANIVRVSLK